MAGKISDYTNSVSALEANDLLDVSELISTGPNVYESRKMTGSVLANYIQANATNIFNTNSIVQGGNYTQDQNGHQMIWTGGQFLLTNSLGFGVQNAGNAGGTLFAMSNTVDGDILSFKDNATASQFLDIDWDLGTNTLSFMDGVVEIGGTGTTNLTENTVIYDGDTVPSKLWSWRDDGSAKLWQDTSFLDASDNTTFKLGELFTGVNTDGYLGFQVGTNYYPINIYSSLAVNDGGFRLRIGTVSDIATVLGNGNLTLSAQSGAELLLQNSAGRMIFQSGVNQLFVVRLNNNSYMPLSSGRGFGVGLTTPESKLHVKGDGTEPVFIAETSGGLNTFQVLDDGSFAIADGITAPTSDTGIAKIYIDTADGDLKIIFSDGTVKTIVTDS